MKKVLIPLMAAIVVAVMAVGMVLPVSANTLAGSSQTLDLIIDGGKDGTKLPVGTVDVSYDSTTSTFTVVYTITDPNWVLVETHVYLDDSSPTKSAPGRFPYSSADTITLTVAAGDTVYFAAHAELQMVDPATGDPIIAGYDADGNPIYVYETGWAQSATATENLSIPPGKNWATYVEWIPVPVE